MIPRTRVAGRKAWVVGQIRTTDGSRKPAKEDVADRSVGHALAIGGADDSGWNARGMVAAVMSELLPAIGERLDDERLVDHGHQRVKARDVDVRSEAGLRLSVESRTDGTEGVDP